MAFEIACLSYEMASLLAARDESVFASAPISGNAQTLQTLTEDVSAVATRGALTSLPGMNDRLKTPRASSSVWPCATAQADQRH